MTIVSQILQQKGTDVWHIAPDETVYAALERMAEKNIGALLVMDGDEILGIFSERDYARRVALKGRTSRETPVREVMTSNVIAVRPDQTVEKCMALMTDKRIRHLPVIDGNGRLVGLISIGDVVKALISEQKIIIDHLEDYITGKKWDKIRQVSANS
ncbi:MAG: CBS domain-containing protein [Chloroflexi bacterium]|nr:MAG: CBS domain-containing protein [Chloroflexota bacterium]